MANYWEKFAEWQNYAHYLLLTGGLFIFHALPKTAVLEASGNYFSMFLWYLFGLFIIDSVVHAIFWFVPKPFQWRD